VLPPLTKVQLAVTVPVETVAVPLSGLYVPKATGVADTVQVTAAVLGKAKQIATIASQKRTSLPTRFKSDPAKGDLGKDEFT
jgi:hypothetical protein